MTKESIESRQVLMLHHRDMQFAYVIDINGKYFGYLTRSEFQNLNPNGKDRIIKVYPTMQEQIQLANKQIVSKFKQIRLSEIEDIRLANQNTY